MSDADTHAARLATLKALGDLQGVMATKARYYVNLERETESRRAALIEMVRLDEEMGL